MSNLIVEIKDVSHSYGDNETTLRNLNLQVNKGEKVAILGLRVLVKTPFSD